MVCNIYMYKDQLCCVCINLAIYGSSILYMFHLLASKSPSPKKSTQFAEPPGLWSSNQQVGSVGCMVSSLFGCSCCVYIWFQGDESTTPVRGSGDYFMLKDTGSFSHFGSTAQYHRVVLFFAAQLDHSNLTVWGIWSSPPRMQSRRTIFFVGAICFWRTNLTRFQKRKSLGFI